MTESMRFTSMAAALLLAWVAAPAHAELRLSCPVQWEQLNALRGADLNTLVMGVKVRDWTPEYLENLGKCRAVLEYSQTNIAAHIETMKARGCKVEQVAIPADCARGTFVAPTIVEIDSIAQLGREVFGPVLHVVRFRRDDLPGLIDAINGTGYGLTFGLHTLLDATVERVTSAV